MGGAYLLSALKCVKGKSLFIIGFIDACKGKEPIYHWEWALVVGFVNFEVIANHNYLNFLFVNQ